MQVPKLLFVTLVSHALLKSASAVLEVITSQLEWEARVALSQCTVNFDDFEDGPNILLVAGNATDIGLFDVFIDELSIFGPLGKINGTFLGEIVNTGPTVLNFHDFDNGPTIAIAGEWTSTDTGDQLQVTINGQTITFGNFLAGSPDGTGFLGFVDEENGINSLVFSTVSTTDFGEFFLYDDARVAGMCIPPNEGCPPGNPRCQGDPHFKTWRGQRFDYHGECDLVLLHIADFEAGLGLDVHIRTKLRRDMSYISSAALRIGTDLLEVASQGVFWFNGVLNAALPDEFSGFAFSHTQPTERQHVFEVYLGGRERIKLKTYRDFVSVLIEQGQNKHFGDSAGLMGDFRMGHMIARDGKTIIDDANAFGQEWQVLDTEPSLFQTVRLPQHPQQVCTLPPPMQASKLRRRLLESSSVAQLTAEKACEHWGEGKDDCVFDVLTTGDLEMALVGAY
jgi:hypothetical protein